MTNKQLIIEQLDDIFNVPKNGANIKDEDEDESQDSAYAEVAETVGNASFDQRIQDLEQKLQKDAPKNDEVITSNTEIKSNEQSKPIEREGSMSKSSFEEILSKSVSSEQPPAKTVQQVVPEPTVSDSHTGQESGNADDDEVRTIDNAISPSPGPIVDQKPNAEGWFLKPPSPMFTRFYQEKAAFIKHITYNGCPLDIAKLTSELRSSSVSTAVELTDIKGMAEKLTRIQDYLDRVVQIKVQATSQATAAKRGVELLRGVLARVLAEKPVARQDGINHEHMQDIELYAVDLASLEQNAKDIYHNLLEAKEILSRKVTIALELLKEQNKTEGLEKNFNSLPEEVKKVVLNQKAASPLADEGFDRLEVQEELAKNNQPKVDKNVKKTGKIDWLD